MRITFKSMRGTDAREMEKALIGTQTIEGRVTRITSIEQLRTAPFDTTITFDVDANTSGDLDVPQTIRAASFVAMARRIISDGGERTNQGYWQTRDAADVVSEYNALIARANAGELK
jgi:hypothetical protein